MTIRFESPRVGLQRYFDFDLTELAMISMGVYTSIDVLLLHSVKQVNFIFVFTPKLTFMQYIHSVKEMVACFLGTLRK